MSRGKFIVLEGGEGSGKGSIRAFLEERFPDALFTREPGGTPLGERIRTAMIFPEAADAPAETQFGLAWAARFDHVKRKISPALQAGKLVVSERFDASTYAYQVVGQEAPHLKPLFFEYRKLLGATVPDLYVFLDVNPKIGLKRASQNETRERPLDHFEKRSFAFHKRVHEGYKEFFKTVPHAVIDASRPLEVVCRDVFATFSTYLRL